tara:strand:+ start:167 stop:937 length:771 start_codon:yes stop_codon:yes gene_type:complete
MFKRKIVIITGAGQGIGKKIAENISNDYDLLLISKSNNCSKLANYLKKKNKKLGRKIYNLKIDLEKKYHLQFLKKKINTKNYSAIHLILCAAIVDPRVKSYLYLKDWMKVFKVNFFSNINIINFFINFYRKSAVQNKIILFSGGGAANSFKEFPIYSASKTALVRTVENYAEIYSGSNINIFAVAPGAIKTRMLQKVTKIARVKTRSKISKVVSFVNFCLKSNTRPFSGKLIHIKDDLNKIYKNKKTQYLKLRRYE